MAIVACDVLVGRQEARGRGTGPRETVMRIEASPSGPARPSAARRSAMPVAISALEVAGQDDREAVGRPAQPREVLGQLGRPAAAGAQGLEDAVAELEAAVEDREVGAVGGQQPAVDPDVPRTAIGHRHATSTPPIAVSGPRALATVSSHSAAGSLR